MPDDTARRNPDETARPDGRRRPIGVFDSGVGGLSVLRAVRRAAPADDLVYVADTAHAPYGDQPPEAIVQRTLRIGRWLADTGAGALVVACNTATAIAVDALRRHVAVPVVAIEPAIKPAVALTRRGIVGVMATTATIRSERMARLCRDHAGGVRLVLQACPGLAERVEAGDLDGPATRALLAGQLAPIRAAGADVVVLGCTHYPFLAGAIRDELGDRVQLVDPAEAVARELLRRLGQTSPPAGGDPPSGRLRLLTTGDPDAVGAVVARLWPQPLAAEPLAGV